MAITHTDNLIVKGALGAFHQAMDSIPQVWENHVMKTSSTTATETYAFPGMIPTPRVFENSRSIQGFRDFKFDVANNTYELTILVNREDFEDDQTGTIQMRFAELGEVFGTYKDQVFADLLANGGTDTAPFDAAAMFGTTRTIGDSAAINNAQTDAAPAAPTAPTAAEFLDALHDVRVAMMEYQDDQGRVGFNANALNDMRVIVPAEHSRAAAEAMTAIAMPGQAGASNIWTGMANVDVLPYLTAGTTFFTSAVGAVRKPFIYQERAKLEVIIDTDPTNVAERNGYLVLCRERWVMTYGDPRRCCRMVLS